MTQLPSVSELMIGTKILGPLPEKRLANSPTIPRIPFTYSIRADERPQRRLTDPHISPRTTGASYQGDYFSSYMLGSPSDPYDKKDSLEPDSSPKKPKQSQQQQQPPQQQPQQQQPQPIQPIQSIQAPIQSIQAPIQAPIMPMQPIQSIQPMPIQPIQPMNQPQPMNQQPINQSNQLPNQSIPNQPLQMPWQHLQMMSPMHMPPPMAQTPSYYPIQPIYEENNALINKRRIIKRRTRTGCLTCRKRRIKCDERKPSCFNCERSKKVCMGYENLKSKKKEKVSNVYSLIE